MTGAASGHVLRVSVQGDHVVLRVDCHQPADADCRTTAGGCILADDHCNDGDMLAEYHDGPDEPLSDGMPIAVSWSSQDGCYEWHGRLEGGPG